MPIYSARLGQALRRSAQRGNRLSYLASANPLSGRNAPDRPFLLLLLLLLLLLHPLASAQPDALEQEAARLIQPLIDEKKTVGVAVGLLNGEQRHVYGFGKVSLESDRTPDGDTVFEIGSITKVFTATLLADMVEDGVVSLDDPVSDLLPDSVSVPTRGEKAITLLHLTTQTSGLSRLPNNLRPANQRNPYADYSVDQLYEYLGSTGLLSEPGEKYLYSNAGVGLLGHALALKAGKDYEALAIERILDPLGMNDTRITFTPGMKSRLAQGYNARLEPAENWDLPTLAGAGALRSTVNDMLKFLAANVGLGQSDLHSAMATTHAERHEAGGPTRIGMGWHRSPVPSGISVWHNGGTGGFRSIAGFLEGKELAVVVLCNSEASVDQVAIRLLVFAANANR